MKWYLDAFFFELMSAYDTLLQELNVVYAYSLKLEPKGVSWGKIKDKLPAELVNYMKEERGKEWFKKARWCRNTAAHHSYIWTGSTRGGFGGQPWHYDIHEVSIYYLDDGGNIKQEEISVCNNLLRSIVEHIHQIWQKMEPQFTKKAVK